MKKRKKEQGSKMTSPSLKVMQGHFFQLLRPMLSTHTDIRDALARCRVGDIEAFEHVLTMIDLTRETEELARRLAPIELLPVDVVVRQALEAVGAK